MNTIIAPTLLSVNLGILKEEIISLQNAGADWIHLDVMDGSFVAPITFGDNLVMLAKSCSNLFLDVHVMIGQPENHLQTFFYAGANQYTFHLEASNNPEKVLKSCKALGIKAGLAIKPETKFEDCSKYLEDCDTLLIMTVNPGFGGQTFISDCLKKIEAAASFIEKNNLPTLIEVDGGINNLTGKSCYDAGARIFAAGTYVVNSKDRKSAISSLRF